MFTEITTTIKGRLVGAAPSALNGVLDCPRQWEPYIWAVETGKMSPAMAVRVAGADRYAFVEAQGRLGPEHKYINGRFVVRSYWKRQCR
jgi:hypothetical protein